MARINRFKSSSLSDLTKFNVADFTNEMLRDFIQVATVHAESSFGSDVEQVEKSINILRSKIGSRRVKGEEKLKRGYWKMNREDLMKRARLLQAHLSIDVFSDEAEEERKELSEETRKKINDRLGVILSDDEFEMFKFIMHDVRKLSSVFDSTMVASIIEESREFDADAVDLIYTIHEAWEEHQGKGWTKEEIQKRIMQKLRELF